MIVLWRVAPLCQFTSIQPNVRALVEVFTNRHIIRRLKKSIPFCFKVEIPMKLMNCSIFIPAWFSHFKRMRFSLLFSSRWSILAQNCRNVADSSHGSCPSKLIKAHHSTKVDLTNLRNPFEPRKWSW